MTRQERGRVFYGIKERNQEALQELGLFVAESPVYYWVCGAQGSGKSLIRQCLSQWVKNKGVNPNEFSDGDYILKAIQKDVNQKWHKKRGDGFMVTDGKLDDWMYTQMMQDLPDHGVNMIEAMRGHDVSNTRDFSYGKLISYMPENIKNKSVIVYVDTPFETRLERNRNRKGDNTNGDFRHIPEDLLYKFSATDDFNSFRRGVNMPTIVIDNQIQINGN